jgi:hypothetical protein
MLKSFLRKWKIIVLILINGLQGNTKHVPLMDKLFPYNCTAYLGIA